MNYKLIAAVMLSGLASIATASSTANPMPPPDIYAAGPTSPPVAKTGLFGPERAAYALLAGVMHQTEAVIAAMSCSLLAGTYELFIFTDGTVNNPDYNFVTVDSPASTFTLYATINPLVQFRGQAITVKQTEPGSLNRIKVNGYYSNATYDANTTTLNIDSVTNVQGINGRFTAYQSRDLKNFYRSTDSVTGLPYIFDWGLKSLSNLGYPIQKYWQRSKSLRNDGVLGRTVIVKERLVGPNACRIVIDTSDFNNIDFFWQSGTLTISTEPPSPAYEFDF